MTAAAALWHDVEHAAYDVDLPVWRELAEATGGPILDLGAGTGRVAIDLAARGHAVTALDRDPELLAALAERDPDVITVTGDARGFDLGTTFALVIAPMQLVQVLGGADGRLGMLRSAHSHLRPGGVFAAALAEPRDAIPDDDPSSPLPDMLERDGWVFSSRPVSVREQSGRVVVTRQRQAVSPTGELEHQSVEIALDLVGAAELQREAEVAGFAGAAWREVPETPDHIGSTVIVCRR